MHNALWDNSVTPKTTLGTSPCYLVYGKDPILPPNKLFSSMQLSQYSWGHPSLSLQNQIDTLLLLEEER